MLWLRGGGSGSHRQPTDPIILVGRTTPSNTTPFIRWRRRIGTSVEDGKIDGKSIGGELIRRMINVCISYWAGKPACKTRLATVLSRLNSRVHKKRRVLLRK